MSKWIKKGDKVLVIAGNDKGNVGAVLARKKNRVLVQGINMRKRHMKARSENQKSEIVSIERAIHISNVCLCDDDANPLKIKVVAKDGKTKELHTVKKDGTTKLLRTIKK